MGGRSSGAQSSWRYDKRGQLISVSTPDGSWAYSYSGMHSGAILDSYTFALSSSQVTGGLSYFRNRFYDPRGGRFTQEDPIGFHGGDHLYAYSQNNPSTFTDSFGLAPDTGIIRVNGVVAIAIRTQLDMSEAGRILRSVEYFIVRNSQCIAAASLAVATVAGEAGFGLGLAGIVKAGLFSAAGGRSRPMRQQMT
jgi:RHS repeat-associated protein